MEPQKRRAQKKRDGKQSLIYSRCLLSKNVGIEVKYVGKNVKSNIEKKIKSQLEGKCIVEGFVKKDSVKIISYSSGVINGEEVRFDAMVDCDVCFPVEGTLINSTAKNITKAGIRAETADESPSPIVCFVSRDHHANSNQFNAIEENDNFMCRVIGQRFELNDQYISVLGEIPLEK